MKTPTYQFSILHLLTATTLIAVQLALITLEAKTASSREVRSGVRFFVIFFVVTIFLQLFIRNYAKSMLGQRIIVVKSPLYRMRTFWGAIVLILASAAVNCIDWGEADPAMLLGAINITYLLIVTVLPIAVIGEKGILYDLNAFTPWKDWQVDQESLLPARKELVLKRFRGFLPGAVHIPKDIPGYDRILALAISARNDSERENVRAT